MRNPLFHHKTIKKYSETVKPTPKQIEASRKWLGYLDAEKLEEEKNISAFVADFTNPSPGIGWNNSERLSIIERGTADTVLALALIHHLCISNNLPFIHVANFFARITSKFLVIEFVPKTDSQVQRLLKTRTDIFTNYNQDFFEQEFSKFFSIIKSIDVVNSERTIYLLKKGSVK